MKLLSNRSTSRNYKVEFYSSFLALLAALYMFYYLYTDYSYFQTQGYSVISYFSDNFGDRLLVFILALIFISGFAFYGNKRTLVYRTEIATYIEFLPDENKCLKHTKITKLKHLKGKKTILSNDTKQSVFLNNLDKLSSFREETINTNSSTSYSLSGVTEGVEYATGTSLVLSKKTYQESTAYKIFAVFKDNNEKEISYGNIRASKFYEIFKDFIAENRA